MAISADAFLAHYGVKGMRWGKSLKTSTSSSEEKTKKEPEKPSEDHENTRKLMTKSVKSLSNSEIQSLNTRLQLERTYKDLSKNQTALNKGNKAAKELLTSVGTLQQIHAVASSPLARDIAKAVSGLR